MSSGGGSVGRAVTSNTRDPRFKSRSRQILSIINWIEKAKIKKKDATKITKKKMPGMAHFNVYLGIVIRLNMLHFKPGDRLPLHRLKPTTFALLITGCKYVVICE